jgi:ABC-type transport system involved in multi-copper enzyme maturation permease subunit
MFILAWVVIGGWLGAIIALIVLKVVAPESEIATDPILSMLFGSLSTNAGMVVGYFFGSSRGSDNKNAMLAAPK